MSISFGYIIFLILAILYAGGFAFVPVSAFRVYAIAVGCALAVALVAFIVFNVERFN
jgi:hypothetical protein